MVYYNYDIDDCESISINTNCGYAIIQDHNNNISMLDDITGETRKLIINKQQLNVKNIWDVRYTHPHMGYILIEESITLKYYRRVNISKAKNAYTLI